MTSARRFGIRRRLWMVAGVGLLGGCTPSVSDVSMAEAMMQIGDVLNAIREENAMLQADLDSLRGAVARQDTLIQRLGAATGVPIPR